MKNLMQLLWAMIGEAYNAIEREFDAAEEGTDEYVRWARLGDLVYGTLETFADEYAAQFNEEPAFTIPKRHEWCHDCNSHEEVCTCGESILLQAITKVRNAVDCEACNTVCGELDPTERAALLELRDMMQLPIPPGVCRD
jgi:hypothetical protein